MKAKELDRKFDDGEDVSDVLDLEKARRPGQEQRRVNVDFPCWMIESREAGAIVPSRETAQKCRSKDPSKNFRSRTSSSSSPCRGRRECSP